MATNEAICQTWLGHKCRSVFPLWQEPPHTLFTSLLLKNSVASRILSIGSGFAGRRGCEIPKPRFRPLTHHAEVFIVASLAAQSSHPVWKHNNQKSNWPTQSQTKRKCLSDGPAADGSPGRSIVPLSNPGKISGHSNLSELWSRLMLYSVWVPLIIYLLESAAIKKNKYSEMRDFKIAFKAALENVPCSHQYGSFQEGGTLITFVFWGGL